MASCITSMWKGSVCPQVQLTVTLNSTSSDGDTAVLNWVLEYVAHGYAANTDGVGRSYTVTINGSSVKTGTYNINGVSSKKTIASGSTSVAKGTAAKSVSFGVSFAFDITWSGVYGGTKSASGTISIPAKTSYTVSYNANGGTGAPSSQTKWYGTSLTLSSAIPTRAGYTFQGWATSASGSAAYAAGASYTANAEATLYAVWKVNTYAVSYDANGGTGAPGNQTKTYGTTLTLSSTKPTRTNYNFKGWATSASATTAAYAAGGNYTENAAVTLYAVWELAYVAPIISNLSVVRIDSTTVKEADGGDGVLVEFDWETTYANPTVTIECEETLAEAIFQLSGNIGSFRGIDFWLDWGLNSEKSYTIKVTVTDSNGYSVVFGTALGMQYTVDFLDGGKGAAFGKPAEKENLLDIAWKTRHFGGLLPVVLEPETNLDNVLTPNTYTGDNTSNNNYVSCPVTGGTFTLLVESCGESGQVKQTYTCCSKYKPERYSRFYYQGEWGAWFWANTDEYILYENDSGSNAAITLAAALSHFRYIEIYFTDNNGKAGGYTKVYKPNGKTIPLQITEPAATIYSRQTHYVLSGTTMTPDITNASYYRITSAGAVSTSFGTNYIKVVRVIGRA